MEISFPHCGKNGLGCRCARKASLARRAEPWRYRPRVRPAPIGLGSALGYFPRYGKMFRGFSTLWKISFHTVEKKGRFFHTMEKVFAVFPHYGKKVSTPWKTVEVRP
jgi:hypothetical protein